MHLDIRNQVVNQILTNILTKILNKTQEEANDILNSSEDTIINKLNDIWENANDEDKAKISKEVNKLYNINQ